MGVARERPTRAGEGGAEAMLKIHKKERTGILGERLPVLCA